MGETDVATLEKLSTVSLAALISVHTLSTLVGLAAVFLNTGDLGNLPNSHFTFCGELLDYFSGGCGFADCHLGCTSLEFEIAPEGGTHKMQCTQSFHGDPGFVAKIVVYEPFSTKSYRPICWHHLTV